MEPVPPLSARAARSALALTENGALAVVTEALSLLPQEDADVLFAQFVERESEAAAEEEVDLALDGLARTLQRVAPYQEAPWDRSMARALLRIAGAAWRAADAFWLEQALLDVPAHVLQQAQDVLEGTDQELLVLVGYVTSAEFGAAPPSQERLATEGARWLRVHQDELRREVCGLLGREVKRKSEAEQVVLVSQALRQGGTLAEQTALFVAAWIVRSGIESWCTAADGAVE